MKITFRTWHAESDDFPRVISRKVTTFRVSYRGKWRLSAYDTQKVMTFCSRIRGKWYCNVMAHGMEGHGTKHTNILEKVKTFRMWWLSACHIAESDDFPHYDTRKVKGKKFSHSTHDMRKVMIFRVSCSGKWSLFACYMRKVNWNSPITLRIHQKIKKSYFYSSSGS